MQAIAREVQATQSLVSIEDDIAPVKEIFRLQGADELLEAEKRYFTNGRNHTQAIVLAATRGQELQQLTQDKPKVMLPIGGKPLLRLLVDKFKKLAINDITVVAGFKAETIDVQGTKVIRNAEYETTGELASLVCASAKFSDDMLIVYGDLLFRSYILQDLLDCPGEIVTVVDSVMSNKSVSGSPDYAYCSVADDLSIFGQDVKLLHISKARQTELGNKSGRWIGMLRLRSQGQQWVSEALNELQKRPDFNSMGIPELCNYLIEQGKPIKVLYIRGNWLDVNSLDDLDLAFQLKQ
jgi:phosphoenolpyruvate phosphomutase